MKKNKNSIIFCCIVIICVVTLVIKDLIGIKQNEYIVSQSSEEEIDSILVKNDENKEVINNEEIEENNLVTVYVTGEVKKTGLVTLENNSRLADAIEILGGLTDKADINKVNMALKIKDEQHYIIPKIGENITENLVTSTNELSSINEGHSNNIDKKININEASIKELDDLPGVGEATANKIIKYREENGSFKSTEEIKNVNGIGDKKYNDIKDLISIN
ncbi:MAG: helix-hairpin-helix domain-containing protein [Peptostreptococcaceae bacterium]